MVTRSSIGDSSRIRNRNVGQDVIKTIQKTRRGDTSTGTVALLALKAVGAGATFANTALLAKLMTAAAIGRYGEFLAGSVVLGAVGGLGQRNLLTGLVGRSGRHSWLIRRSLVASSVVSTAAVLAWLAATGQSSEMPLLLYLAVLGWAWIAGLEGLLLGGGRPVASVVGSQVLRPVTSLVFVLIAQVWFPITFALVAMAHIFGLGVALLFSGVVTLSFLHRRRGIDDRHTESSRWWASQSVLYTSLSVVAILGSRLDVLLLGELVSDAELGAYFNAAVFATLPQFALVAANTTALPSILAANRKGDVPLMGEQARSSVRFSILLSVPMSVLGITAYSVLSTFGWAIENGLLPLCFLMLGQVVNSACGCSGQLLAVTGNHGSVIGAHMLALASTAALIVVLVPKIGISGAAIGGATGITLWNLLLAWRTWSVFGINTTIIGPSDGTWAWSLGSKI